MVGVRRFDEGAVLDRIVEAFWRGGYEGTSVDDLVAATGLKRGSLYNAFGDKEAMFLAALDRYAGRLMDPVRQALADPNPRRGLADVMEAYIALMEDQSCPRGCLAVGACAELGGRDDALGRRVAAELVQAEVDLTAAIARWQSAGRLRSDRDPRQLARFLASLVQGMATVHKATGDAGAIRDAASVGLTVVDSWMDARQSEEMTPGPNG